MDSVKNYKKKLNNIDYSSHKNIGIDDFSTKKREKYCTIINDNDTKKRINIIDGRTKEIVIEELKKFTNVETVTRDLSITYKEAIAEALPNAIQIADRFHIETNFTDNIIEYMKRTIDEKIILNEKDDRNVVLSSYEKKKKETAQRKWNIIQQVKNLKKKGWSNLAIANNLGICDETVAKYLNIKKPPIQDSHSLVDDYITDIKQAIIENKTKKQIYEIIKNKGYKGKDSILYHRLKSIRNEVKHDLITLKRSQLKKILFVDKIEEIKKDDVRLAISLYLKQNEEFSSLIDILKEFKVILFAKDSLKLESWIDKAKALNIPELTQFTNLVESDIDAVKNAIIYNYSNGLTEGINNKTKVIKREMYGRCSVELLKIKLLA